MDKGTPAEEPRVHGLVEIGEELLRRGERGGIVRELDRRAGGRESRDGADERRPK